MEIAFPVEDATLRDEVIHEVLPRFLNDHIKARELQSDGTYFRLHMGAAFNTTAPLWTVFLPNGTTIQGRGFGVLVPEGHAVSLRSSSDHEMSLSNTFNPYKSLLQKRTFNG